MLATALVTPATAITKTYVQDNQHTFVGLIGFYNGKDWTWSHRCTGELIAPTVVLTAGHCTDNGAGGVNDHARIWFQQGAGVNYDPATQHDPVTGYPDECLAGTLGSLCAESDLMFNYGFNNFAGFPNILDVGIVILDQPITGLGYATLAPAQTLDALLKSRGTQDTTFGVSGYGISFSAKRGAFAISFRERLMAAGDARQPGEPQHGWLQRPAERQRRLAGRDLQRRLGRTGLRSGPLRTRSWP